MLGAYSSITSSTRSAKGSRRSSHVAFAQRVGRVLQEDSHDVLARRREARIVHGRHGHLEQRTIARDGRTWRRPRRVPRSRSTGRCAWWRDAAGRAFRAARGNRAGRSSARFILSEVPSDAVSGAWRTGIPRAAPFPPPGAERWLPDRDSTPRRGRGISSPPCSTTPRARPSRTRMRSTAALVRMVSAAAAAPNRPWLSSRRPCRRARIPTGRAFRPRRPCSGAAGCRPCRASAGRRWRRSRRRSPASL